MEFVALLFLIIILLGMVYIIHLKDVIDEKNKEIKLLLGRRRNSRKNI